MDSNAIGLLFLRIVRNEYLHMAAEGELPAEDLGFLLLESADVLVEEIKADRKPEDRSDDLEFILDQTKIDESTSWWCFPLLRLKGRDVITTNNCIDMSRS